MEPKTLNELIDYFLQEKRKGMEYNEIRKILKSKNIKEEQIKVIIRTIDDVILREMTIKSQNQKALEIISIGIVATLAGLVITIGTFIGFLNMGDSFLLVYGPIFGGIAILLTGIRKYKRS